jgi:hypothetical protein
MHVQIRAREKGCLRFFPVLWLLVFLKKSRLRILDSGSNRLVKVGFDVADVFDTDRDSVVRRTQK